jgi:hypothetical protein
VNTRYSKWARRIQRAEELAVILPQVAAEFAWHLARPQFASGPFGNHFVEFSRQPRQETGVMSNKKEDNAIKRGASGLRTSCEWTL